jgi:hypothetical protein
MRSLIQIYKHIRTHWPKVPRSKALGIAIRACWPR